MAQSQATCQQDSALTLRPASDVMRLPALGASFAHRLSFKEHYSEGDAVHEVALDEEGFGHAVLVMPFYGKEYALIAYSRPLDDADRQIVTPPRDASFYCLMVSRQAISRISEEVTHQAGSTMKK